MEHITSREERHRVDLGFADLEAAVRAFVKAPKDAEVKIDGHHLEAVVQWKVELP